MTTYTTCPTCGQAPTMERLSGKWNGYRYKARLVDACGKHTAYGYSVGEAVYLYNGAVAYTRQEAKRRAHEASIPQWIKLLQRLTQWLD